MELDGESSRLAGDDARVRVLALIWRDRVGV